jgi:hypothetical protein
MPENGQIQGGASVENLPNLNVHASINVLGSQPRVFSLSLQCGSNIFLKCLIKGKIYYSVCRMFEQRRITDRQINILCKDGAAHSSQQRSREWGVRRGFNSEPPENKGSNTMLNNYKKKTSREFINNMFMLD